jgi:hypothetical protein
MAEITAQPDGSAQITVSAAESAGLRAIAATHLPFLKKAAAWFDADIAPEVRDAADFLETLATSPVQGTSLAISPSQMQALRGMLSTHISDFQQVLSVVDSPPVKSMLNLAKALL